MLKTVTMTGADDSIHPRDLLLISEQFPFVEWGLLLSRNSVGQNRFPSRGFLEKIQLHYSKSLKLSGHLCGGFVREILIGDDGFIESIPTWDMFQRIQINTHGVRHGYNSYNLKKFLDRFPEKEFIFQYDNTNKAILESIIFRGAKNVSTLFDLSHGAGVLPEDWPDPIPGVKCGYAGGISPDNIAEQIQKVELKTGDLETWVDMETKVRSDNDRKFDLHKVKICLSLSSHVIK